MALAILFLLWASLGIWLFFQERSPTRTVTESSGIDLLWEKHVEIGLEHESQGQIFSPYQDNLIFPSSNSLVSLSLENGNVLWEAQIPDKPVAISFYEDKFFVMYAKQLEGSKRVSFENFCYMGRGASVSTYDARTGKLIWENSYFGVDRQGFMVSHQILYLHASDDHGASWSSGQVDANTGKPITYACIRWNSNENNDQPPRVIDEGITGYFGYIPKQNYSCDESQCNVVIKDHAIEFMDKNTNESIGHVAIQGFRLHPDNIGLKILDNIILIYLSDSRQLFAFRFADRVGVGFFDEGEWWVGRRQPPHVKLCIMSKTAL